MTNKELRAKAQDYIELNGIDKNTYQVEKAFIEGGKMVLAYSSSDIQNVSDNEERVAVVCSTCNWQHAKYEYKCEGCTLTYKNWEQDTDR